MDSFFQNKSLNKKTPIPLYYQLKEILSEYISQHQERVVIPTENDLCSFFSISRTTVRQALNELTSEESIERHKSKGSFSIPKKTNQNFLQVLESFNDEMHEKGLIPATEVLTLTFTKATAQIAEKLSIAKGSDVVLLVRLRKTDAIPMVLVTTYLPANYNNLRDIVNEDMVNQSMYAVMREKFHTVPVRTTRFIEAKSAGKFESEELHIPQKSAMLVVETIASDEHDVPIEFSRASYRGDKNRFVIGVHVRQKEE